MATYPLILSPSFSYEDHLMHNAYVSDINLGISQIGSDISYGQRRIAETIEENSSFISSTILSGTNQISDYISELTDVVEFGLEQVNEGISGLRSDFNIAMGQVITQFEMMRSEMQEGFNKIGYLLENKRKVEAHEHFSDALKFYNDGCRFPNKSDWFENSLKHFLLSLESYDRNPLAHLHVGHIYHYQKALRNFDKAMNHYEKCGTYGEADSTNFSVAAQGYFYAGWLKAAVYKDIEEAINLTKMSTELDPKLSESYYHLAKFYILNKNKSMPLNYLEKVIVEHDRNYCVKVSKDPDFDPIRQDVNHLIIRLKERALKKIESELSTLNINFDPKDISVQKKINDLYKKIINLIKEDKYFSILDAKKYLETLKKYINNGEKILINYYNPCVIVIDNWENFIDKFKRPPCGVFQNNEGDWAPSMSPMQSDVERMLDKAKYLFTKEKADNYKEILKIAESTWVKAGGTKTKNSTFEDFWNKPPNDWIETKEFNEMVEKQISTKKCVDLKQNKSTKINRGKCLKCGKPLGILEKIRGQKYCRLHR